MTDRSSGRLLIWAVKRREWIAAVAIGCSLCFDIALWLSPNDWLQGATCGMAAGTGLLTWAMLRQKSRGLAIVAGILVGAVHQLIVSYISGHHPGIH